MTPKEKAKQLVNRFDESLNHLTCGTNGIERHIRERAVACALIAVDEIMPYLEFYEEQYGDGLFEHDLSFWREVKQEIQKM